MVNDVLDLCLVTVQRTIYPMLLFPVIAVGRLAGTFFREFKAEGRATGRAGLIISSSNQGCPICVIYRYQSLEGGQHVRIMKFIDI